MNKLSLFHQTEMLGLTINWLTKKTDISRIWEFLSDFRPKENYVQIQDMWWKAASKAMPVSQGEGWGLSHWQIIRSVLK